MIKLNVKKDRLKINKIIENCLPLMKMNKNMTQECADCIILYFIEKGSPKTSKQKSFGNIKQIKTKKVPIELELKKKDGSTVKIKATKIVKDS